MPPVEVGPLVLVGLDLASGHVTKKALALRDAQALSRESSSDNGAVYDVLGDTKHGPGVYTVHLLVQPDGWAGACEHPTVVEVPMRHTQRHGLCSHILAAALAEAEARGVVLPEPGPDTPPCPYEQYQAAMRRHNQRAEEPLDWPKIEGWRVWRIGRNRSVRAS